MRVAELNDGMKAKKSEGVIYSTCDGVTHSQGLPAKLRERAAGCRLPHYMDIIFQFI
jgi:hypothetical protein